MFYGSSLVGRLSRPGRWAVAATAVVGLGLSGGCTGLDLRGEKFRDNSLGTECRQFRATDRNNELFGVSNKAQQIEKDLGIQ